MHAVRSGTTGGAHWKGRPTGPAPAPPVLLPPFVPLNRPLKHPLHWGSWKHP